MNKNWKRTVTSVVITASLMTGSIPVLADGTPADANAQAAATYKLTDLLDVELKSVLNEKVLEGTRIGVVVRLKNKNDAITRVPDYELRVKTAEGVEYTLQPSASNPKAIQPKANSELSFMSVVDRTDEVKLAEVNWTDVDYYVYPKKETIITAIPVTDTVWNGSDTAFTDPAAIKKWSDSFVIPSLQSPIQYTPVGISKESTPEGTVQIVQLLAFNPSDKRETVPDFVIEGRTETKVYSGKRVEEGAIALEAKEEKYIHYAIPTDQDTALLSLNLLTPEKFAQGGAAAGGTADGAAAGLVQYNVGRLNILLPAQSLASTYGLYTLGTPMVFDMRSELIHPNIDVSLVEFQMHENEEEGNNTVTAKVKLFNKSDRPLAVPVFQLDLLSSDGYEYSGQRQSMSTASILPNSGVVVNYSITVPKSETGKGLAFKIQDTKTAAPYKSTIASYRAELQEQKKGDSFSVYPFNIKVRNWDVSYMFNAMNQTYSYKGKFFLDIEREEQIQVDQNFSKLQFEIYDKGGRLLATSVNPLIGAGRMVSGENNIVFNGTSEQFDSPITIKIFEVFTTDNGEAKRLLTEFVR